MLIRPDGIITKEIIDKDGAKRTLYSKDNKTWFYRENLTEPVNDSSESFNESPLSWFDEYNNQLLEKQEFENSVKFVPDLDSTNPSAEELDHLDEITEEKDPSQLHPLDGEDGGDGEDGEDEGDGKPGSKFDYNKLGKSLSEGFTQLGNAIPSNISGLEGDTRAVADAAYNTAAASVSKFNPLIGNIMKTSGAANKMLEAIGIGGTDNMTKQDAALGAIPVLNQINGLLGKKSNSFSIDQDVVADVGDSYGGSVATLNSAQEKANKKYGLFSSGARRRANRLIAKAKQQQGLMTSIADEAADRKVLAESMSDLNDYGYGFLLKGGYDQRYNRVAKEGMKFDIVPILTDPVRTAKEGMKLKESEEKPLSDQKSVIPEGALHKNKHHMEHSENFTKKGITVIDNDGDQQAEIELNEIIFTLEVTKKIEEAYRKYYSDETKQSEKDKLATEIGKLLWREILYNTDDRTNLINTLKQGGIISCDIEPILTDII